MTVRYIVILCQLFPTLLPRSQPGGLTVFVGVLYVKSLNRICTFLGNKIDEHSDVVGASPVGAAPTTSELSTPYN